jgi:hypothetical protein
MCCLHLYFLYLQIRFLYPNMQTRICAIKHTMFITTMAVFLAKTFFKTFKVTNILTHTKSMGPTGNHLFITITIRILT